MSEVRRDPARSHRWFLGVAIPLLILLVLASGIARAETFGITVTIPPRQRSHAESVFHDSGEGGWFYTVTAVSGSVQKPAFVWPEKAPAVNPTTNTTPAPAATAQARSGLEVPNCNVPISIPSASYFHTNPSVRDADPIRESDCIDCMACEVACPTKCIKISP